MADNSEGYLTEERGETMKIPHILWEITKFFNATAAIIAIIFILMTPVYQIGKLVGEQEKFEVKP